MKNILFCTRNIIINSRTQINLSLCLHLVALPSLYLRPCHITAFCGHCVVLHHFTVILAGALFIQRFTSCFVYVMV